MARYINAERLKDRMFAYYDCLEESANGRPYKGDTLMDYEVVDMIEECIESAPPADVVEVKHGEWIFCERVLATDKLGLSIPLGWYECSICGRIELHEEPYCNCGAKMDGGVPNVG